MMTYAASASTPTRPLSKAMVLIALALQVSLIAAQQQGGKAYVGLVKASSPTRPTLSSNWDFRFVATTTTTSAPRVPRFEELDTTNMLLRQRIIFLGSQVDDMTTDLIINQLLFLDAEDLKKDITLFINLPGGSVLLLQSTQVPLLLQSIT